MQEEEVLREHKKLLEAHKILEDATIMFCDMELARRRNPALRDNDDDDSDIAIFAEQVRLLADEEIEQARYNSQERILLVMSHLALAKLILKRGWAGSV